MKDSQISIGRNLETRRMTLRLPKLEDATGIFSVVASPDFPEQLPLKALNSLERIEAWLKRLSELREDGQVYSWIMEERASKQLLGQVTLSKIEGNDKWALAFWTHPEKWGNGYATEGAQRVMQFAFEELGAKTIWAAAGKWNTGSNRVLEKLDMNYIGDNPQGYYSKGELVVTREYEISANEFSNLDIE